METGGDRDFLGFRQWQGLPKLQKNEDDQP
jgi:hypothetical protein